MLNKKINHNDLLSESKKHRKIRNQLFFNEKNGWHAKKNCLQTYKRDLTERDLSKGTGGMLSTTELYHPELIFKFVHKK